MCLRLSFLAPLAAAVFAFCVPLAAQEARPTEQVSLRTDQALDIFLDVIRESREQKDWPRAFRALEEIERFINTNGQEYILPVSGSAGRGKSSLYTSAREAAYRELATFPEQGLVSWRLAADSAVSDALEACRLRPEPSQLEKTVAQYPISSHSSRALNLLGAIYLECADFPGALRVCARSRAYLPNMPKKEKARFDLLRIICLARLTGARPERLVADFEREYSDLQLSLRGKTAPAMRVLAESLDSTGTSTAPIPELKGGVGAIRWSAQFPPLKHVERLIHAAENCHIRPGLQTAPVAAGDKVLFCDNIRVRALDAAAGEVVWSHTVETSPDSASIHNAFCRPATDGRIAAASLGSKLCVLDLESGALKWSTAPGHGEDTVCVYLSSPCISGDTVLVGATAWGQEMTCLLLAYDIESGARRWARRVVTGFPTNTFGLGSQPSPPVTWGGLVYFVTNLGAVVCVDIENGDIIWLRKYAASDSLLKGESIAGDRRWALCPPVIHRGVLIVAPQDSQFLFAADAVEGTLLWQEPRVGLSELRYFGGAWNDLVFAAGSVVRAFNYRTGKTAWTASLPHPGAGPVVVFRDRLIVPCGEILIQLEPAKGQLLGKFLMPGEPDVPQHLVAFRESLLHSTLWELKRFRCYHRKTAGDLTGLLARGALQWRTGEFDRGIKTLEDGLANLTEDEVSLKVRFVEEIETAVRTAAANSTGARRGEYFERAAKHAAAPQQPALLLEAAKAYEDASLPEKALRVCREVLVNHQARNVTLAGHRVYADDYARICEKRIFAGNPALREKQEKVADKLAAEVAKTPGPHRLFDIMRTFPNSQAAARAYIELGEYCLKEKLLESADLYLNEFLARHPRSPHADKVRVLLCETYLGKNDTLRAKGLLQQLAQADSTVKLGAGMLRVSDYAKEKLALAEVARANLADSLVLPLSSLWQTTPCLAQSAPDTVGVGAAGRVLFTLGPSLLDCRDTQTGALLARFDLSDPPESPAPARSGVVVPGGAVILRGKRLLMVGTGGEKPAWKWGATLPQPDQVPGIKLREDALLSKSAGSVLVLWPRSRLMMFDGKTGALAWTHTSGVRYFASPAQIGAALVLVQADGAAVVGLDPKSGARRFTTKLKGRPFSTSSVVACGDKILIVRGSRDLYCVDKGGSLLWSKKGDDFTSGAVYLPPDRVAMMPGPGARREVTCLNLKDGGEAWKAHIGKDLAIRQLADHERLYVAQRPRFGLISVTAFDVATGKKLWTWRQSQGFINEKKLKQTPTHLLVPVEGRALSQLYLVNKERGVQDQSIAFPGETFQCTFVHGGRLYATTDRCAYCFGLVMHARAREDYVGAIHQLHRAPAGREELQRIAARYAEFRDFNNAAQALREIVRSDWKLSDAQTRRLLEQAGGYRYGQRRTRATAIDVHRIRGPVKVDGVLDDGWIPALALQRGIDGVFKVDRRRIGGDEWLSKHDLCATYYFGWDKENFYFAVDARDSIIRPWDRDDKDNWKGDLLLIALDPLGDGGWLARADDVLLSMGLVVPRRNPTPEEREEEERNKPKGEYFVKRREDDSGAVYEARIPWELFNENGTNIDTKKGPPDGLTFGLDLVLLDDDTGGGTTKTLSLARGLLLGKRSALWRGFVPRNFATMRLKDK